ncbi:hypothetical protein Q8A67_008913 [Cirrhinus molitorella]|uniref:Ig-like domain-containing protein n=1 Tax=Cirrhinus molitorella TaxID=172907 RepID=A0AA88TP40_9TELE|nr:hypothetical protein Q8A67_008913 [Cirrhinus molitorella]
MDRCFLFLMLITIPGVFADSIEPKDKENIISKEGDSQTLRCTYDTSSNYAMLYWYRQYPNREPQYLLRKGARSWSYSEDIPDHHFQSTTSDTSTVLTITSVTLLDSAPYYCALRTAAQ